MINQRKKRTATVLSFISRCKYLEILKDTIVVVLLLLLKLLFAFLLALLYLFFLPIFTGVLWLIFRLDNRFKFLLVIKTPNVRIQEKEDNPVIYNTSRGNSHA
ncbi:hypothetical protein SAMN06265182_0982 [Persephonella hydrogeniphila]|uniref:Uncharacterized protein n=1 Tax=Persephonella hydrogeniphila TaxID=198703 RepID=A0A285NFH4_9AQUI|nr:hypothetical protein SAMN06265182_0982 [Persephonella hydrogeniphila]